MVNRIQKIMNHYGFTATKFAQEIGIQRSALSHIMSGRNKPSLDFILKLKNRFPEIDTDWLLFGHGEMFVEKVSNPTQLNLEWNTKMNKIEGDALNSIETATVDDKKKSPLQESKEDRDLVNIVLLFADGTFKRYRSR